MSTSRFPDSLVLIALMIVVAQVATLVLPRGTFERDGRNVVPGTYRRIVDEPAPEPESEAAQGFWEEFGRESADFLDTTPGRVVWIVPATLLAIPRGLEAAAEVIFFVFLVGGVIAVLRRTGAIDALLGTAIERLGGRPVLLVGGMTALFAVGSSTIGMAEEYMPFVPVLVTLCLGLGMDAIVAMAIVYVGAGVGYGCAALNPFTVALGQDIAGLSSPDGWEFRTGLLVVCLAVGVHHTMRYARRVRASAEASLVADVDYSEGFEPPEDTELTIERKAILLAFAAMIGAFVVGAKYFDWYFHELAALFLGLAVFAAMVAGLSPNVTARAFCTGAAELTTTALLIGFARTIEVVLSEGQVIDTVIHGIAQPLERVGASGSAVGMLAVQSVCNFFIPSGSGQAYVTMPIMAPLADLTGVTRQTAVLAYQLGDGLTNMVVPTNALLMGMLGLGKIPFQRWLRFVLPLLGKLYVVAVAALLLAVAIGYA